MSKFKETVRLVIFTVFMLAYSHPVVAGEIQTTTLSPDADIHVFDYRAAPLGDVLKVFSVLTKKNVVATPEIQGLEISMYLENIRPRPALITLCKNYNLWFVEEPDVIRIMKVEEYARELVLRRDEHTRVFNLKYASCKSVAEMVECIFGDRIDYEESDEEESFGHVGTDDFPEIGDDSDSNTDRSTNSSTKYIGALGGQESIQIPEESYGKLKNVGGDGEDISAEELLRLQIGRAQAFMTVFLRNNAVIVRSVDHRLLDDIHNLVQSVDTPTRQVLLEVKILEITLGDGFDSFFDMSITPDGTLTDTGEVKRDTRGVTGIDLVNIAGLAENSLQLEFIDKQVQARMELLEKTNRIKKIGTPLMLCANNAAASFFQGINTPVRKGYSVSSEREGTDTFIQTFYTVVPEYEEEEIGVSLEISPSINVDRTITLKIVSEISTLEIGGGPPFYYIVNNQQQGGETDSVRKTTIEDIIVAMDKQSLALGGLIQEEDINSEKKVPVLGDIPWLGFFFKSQGISKKRTEIVFTITPHIIMTPEAAGKVNDELMEDLSEHPYYRDKQDRLLEYDPEWDTIK